MQRTEKWLVVNGGGCNLNTYVTESTPQGDIPVDVYQKLSSNRVIFINSFIDDKLASDVVATLLYLDLEKQEKITIFLNTLGGDIRNILMIYDTMSLLRSPIETFCLGEVEVEAVVLLCAGTPGNRFATKNSGISIGHLINDGVMFGNLTDAKNTLDLYSRDNKSMMKIISKHSKIPLKKLLADFGRKKFLTSAEALKYGLIDKVISSPKKVNT